MYLQLHCCLCHGDGDCGEQRGGEKKASEEEESGQKSEFPGSLRLLGLLPHLAGQPHQHPLCHRRGKSFTFHLIIFPFQPEFLFQMLTSVAAVALPNWRHLELAVGLVLIKIGVIALSLEYLDYHWNICIIIGIIVS